MKTTIFTVLVLFVHLFTTTSIAQFNIEWAKQYAGTGSGHDGITAMTTDASGNIYVTGVSYAGTSFGTDFITIKYNSNGDSLWVKRFTGPGNNHDTPYSIAVDGAGNVYVSGYSSPDFGYFNLTTIKYSPAGDNLWVKQHAGYGGNSTSMAIDQAGNVYVTGDVPVGFQNIDVITTKYNTNGDSLWAKRFDGASHREDTPVKLKTDASGFVYIVCQSVSITTNIDFLTIKYTGTSGDSVWVARFNGALSNNDIPSDFIVDAAGNVYVTGTGLIVSSNGGDFVTVKYNSSGAQQWASYYNFSIYADGATSIDVDASGNVYVTGASRVGFTNTDFATIKYNSDGVQQWLAGFDGQFHNNDIPTVVKADASGNVYVTGSSYYLNASNTDIVVIKYNSAGVQQLFGRYDSTSNEGVSALHKDASGVILAGVSNANYILIKYSELIGIQNISSEIPGTFKLSQNYPNPFNPTTNIEFAISKASSVKLSVYDMTGKQLEILVNEKLNAGTYRADWNASEYSSGVYFYRLIADNFTETKKMILVK